MYWTICLVVVFGTIIGFSALEGTPRDDTGSVTRFLIPAGVVAFVVLPIVMLDLVAFSNRFAGPVLNFRNKFRKLVQDHETTPISFRAGDFFVDLRDNYNELVQVIQFKPKDTPTEDSES